MKYFRYKNGLTAHFDVDVSVEFVAVVASDSEYVVLDYKYLNYVVVVVVVVVAID